MEMNGPCNECVFPVESLDFRWTDRSTPLMTAVRNGHELCVNAWIEAGADVNSKDVYGYTALIIAASQDHLMIVNRLIEADRLLYT